MASTVDESQRRRALDTYRVVDTLPEAAYDDIVRLAALICGVPVALVSLIDRDRQWFKARVGMELQETSRDVAFCDHAIRQPELLMEVRDARLDPRFSANPLVTGEMGIRFYAGMPLVTPGGAAIGTVCVIDQQPRELDAAQRSALAALARLTMNLLEGRQRERELERAALLATVVAAEPAPAAPASAPVPCCVAIFEVQHFAGVCAQRGERTMERALARLEALLDAPLRHARGDSVSRVSGGAEVIVVLHGGDVAPLLQSLCAAVAAFEAETGLTILSVAVDADPPGEPVGRVFMRADEALSRLKDERATQALSS